MINCSICRKLFRRSELQAGLCPDCLFKEYEKLKTALNRERDIPRNAAIPQMTENINYLITENKKLKEPEDTERLKLKGDIAAMKVCKRDMVNAMEQYNCAGSTDEENRKALNDFWEASRLFDEIL